MSIELTDRAAKEVLAIMKQQDIASENTYLRLGAQTGGCCGMSYRLGLTPKKNNEDQEIEAKGVKCIIDPQSYKYLEKILLDYKDDETGRGFVFHNPDANSCCSCGSSFKK